eukprot:118038-Rhodomonas_salina.1
MCTAFHSTPRSAPPMVRQQRSACPAARHALETAGFGRTGRCALRVRVDGEQEAVTPAKGAMFQHPKYEEPIELEPMPAAFDEVLGMLRCLLYTSPSPRDRG